MVECREVHDSGKGSSTYLCPKYYYRYRYPPLEFTSFAPQHPQHIQPPPSSPPPHSHPSPLPLQNDNPPPLLLPLNLPHPRRSRLLKPRSALLLPNSSPNTNPNKDDGHHDRLCSCVVWTLDDGAVGEGGGAFEGFGDRGEDLGGGGGDHVTELVRNSWKVT
ncbi:hypothetical protein G7K_5476-t1 [Saitoella complicata NRRL Y-17804]|uniref:Uncharacterized protein n=1 Tax=Saitoella complicata (strain BCRC 22490 / CBS 7301 / JCM 7358 / NBRC 10748 / NRRL Y-17804) TaxID=698492 RepID=A0A0E9NNH7_SAICN|nr:hypothetical protein G7K_5476-t1 [Saitoella complicata NRRL Y-17804]